MRTEIVLRSLELQEANRRLERASTAKNDFLSRMSHELRTPLTAILGFSELLSLSELDSERREWVSMILNASDHLLGLVNEVLDLAKIEAGQVSVSLEPVPVDSVLAEVAELMRPVARSHGVELPEPLVRSASRYVMADHQRLKQVIINLVSNAIKYNRENGSVTISAAEAGPGRVRISVEDTGHGLEDAAMARLFTPFERLEAAGSTIEGSGIGLALSRNLVELMDGTMGVNSTPGTGSTFWLDLHSHEPVAVIEAAAADADADDEPEIRLYETDRLILYVEDTVANLRLVESILHRRPSITLLPAMLGRVGYDLARKRQPDLVMLDLHLPDMHGEALVRQLRSAPETRHIPVVVLSADATRPQRERVLAAGASAYLTKPMRVHDLLRVFDDLLQAPAAGGIAGAN